MCQSSDIYPSYGTMTQSYQTNARETKKMISFTENTRVLYTAYIILCHKSLDTERRYSFFVWNVEKHGKAWVEDN